MTTLEFISAVLIGWTLTSAILIRPLYVDWRDAYRRTGNPQARCQMDKLRLRQIVILTPAIALMGLAALAVLAIALIFDPEKS